jgi:RNA polymerase sigma-70 factor (ECF subfamily)
MDSIDQDHDGPIGIDEIGEIVRRHSASVYRLAYRLTGNAHDAEDLMQDVFIRMLRFHTTFKGGTIRGWLHWITVNLFRDSLRRQHAVRFQPLGELALARLPSAEPTPPEVFSQRNLDDDIRAALDDLSPGLREAVILRHIEDVSHEEIATRLGIATGTARARAFRGRARLREALADRRPA